MSQVNEIKMFAELKEYVSSKCYEVISLKEFYEDCRDRLVNETNDLKTSTFWMNDIGTRAEQMNKYYYQYTQGYRDISQLCHILGGDYLKFFENMLGEQKNDSN